MRLKKWISALIVLTLLCAVIPMGMAEEEIVIELADEVEATDSGEDVVDDSLDVEILIDEDSEDEIPGEALLLEIDEADLEADKTGSDDVIEAAPAVATNDNGDLEIDEDGVLVRYKGFDKNVVIPSSVKVIGSEAFEGDTQLESVTIPSSVTYIGYQAFLGCNGLKSITIPDSVTYIGDAAFIGCTGLKSITIPDSVTETGRSVLSGCTSLTSVQLSSKLTELASSFFSDCDSLKTISIPSGIKSIGYWAFESCNSLTTVSIPSTVTEIERGAFEYCESLKTITLPNGVVSIGYYSFGSCYALESVTIPASVTSIDRGAFFGSNNVVIRGTAGTYAEKYANGMGIPFNAPVVSFDEETHDFWDEDESYDAVIVYANQTRTLKTVQKPSDLATTLKWSSSNTRVATVDSNGNVKGIAQGTATITAATANGKGKAAQIKVFVPEPSEISLRGWWEDDKVKVAWEQTKEISVNVSTPYSSDTNIDFPVKWTTSNSSIVSIISTGKDSDDYNCATLKGCKAGTATITATTPDGGKATIPVEVYPPVIYINNRYNIDDNDELVLGGTTKIYARAYDSYVNDPLDLTITWSSSDKSIVSIENTTKDSEGYYVATLKGLKIGKATLTASTADGSKATITVEVYPPHPDSIKIDQKGPIKLFVGKTYALTTTMSPENAVAKLTWSSYDKKVATVSSSGVITAVAEGWTNIYVETDNERWAEIEVEVLPIPPTSIKLGSGKFTLGVGEDLYIKPTMTPAKSYSPLVSFSSNKTSVVNGWIDGEDTVYIYAINKGTAKITVKTENGKKATATITVKAAPKKVTLNKKGTAKLTLGKTLQLKATLTKGSASALTWTSSNKKVAKVSKSGKVTAVGKGTATITVKTFNKKKATVKVTVSAPTPTKISLGTKPVTMKVKQTLTLKPTFTPKNAESKLTWTSSNKKVATVSSKGVVTAKKKGTTTITVKTANNRKATLKITVK